MIILDPDRLEEMLKQNVPEDASLRVYNRRWKEPKKPLFRFSPSSIETPLKRSITYIDDDGQRGRIGYIFTHEDRGEEVTYEGLRFEMKIPLPLTTGELPPSVIKLVATYETGQPETARIYRIDHTRHAMNMLSLRADLRDVIPTSWMVAEGAEYSVEQARPHYLRRVLSKA